MSNIPITAQVAACDTETLSPLQKAQSRMRALREQGIQIVHLDPLEKANANPNSLRLAINAKCFDCVGRGHDPNWRGAVGHCQIVDCGLHGVRPFQKTADGVDDDLESGDES